MKVVGLTGGIGSGKSTVADFFGDLGVPVYNSDIWAKVLMNSSESLMEEIILLLGKEAYGTNGLNRAYVANQVFGTPELLKELNGLVHPEVRKHFKEWIETQHGPYVIQESALIFENGYEKRYDRIILVVAPEKIRIERVKVRDGTDEASIRSRMRHQLSDVIKRQKADFIIENVDLETTKKRVAEIHSALLCTFPF